MDISLTAKGNRYFRLRVPGASLSDPPLSQHTDVASAYEAAVKHAIKHGVDGIYTVQPPDRWEIETMGFKATTVPPPASAGQLWLTASQVSAIEGTSFSFSVQRGAGSAGAVAVDYEVILPQGSPVPAAGTLSWANGDTSAKTVTVALQLVTSSQVGSIALSNPRSTAGGAAPVLGTDTCVLNVSNDVTAPAAVTLTAQAQSSSVIQLTFSGGTDTGSGFKEYVLERSLTGSGGWSEIARPTAAGTYSDTGRSANTQYFYRARAVDKAGNVSANTTANATTPAQGGASTVFPLVVSSDGRRLQTQTGADFYVNGRASWSGLVALTDAQWASYLDDCVSRGINAIIVNLIEHQFAPNPPRNTDNQAPFTTAEDIRTPNAVYFDRCVTMLNVALSKNILVFLSPVYLGYGGGSEGWWSALSARTVQECTNLGTYLGQKLKDLPNLILAMGGDASGSQYNQKQAAVVNAMRAAGNPAWLAGWHTERNVSSYDSSNGQSWFAPPLGINFTYTGDANIAERLATDYGRLTVRPVVYYEGYYKGLTNESGQAVSNQTLRAQGWLALVCGARGSFVGLDPQWYFGSGYLSQLNDSAVQDRTRLKQFVDGLAGKTLVPDRSSSVLTAGAGSGAATAAAARAADGSLIVAYTPTQKQLTIAMGQISGASADTYWLNPSTGEATTTVNYANSGSRNFTPPSSGDWVLVIKAAGSSGGGSVSHGDEVTITGSGFGSAMPTFTFTGGAGGLLESTTTGAKPSGVAAFANGWCWDRWNISNQVCAGYTDASRGKVIRINYSGSGEAAHEYTFSPQVPADGGKLMVKYYARYSFSGSGGGRQCKMLRVCAGTSNVEDNNHNFLYTQRDGEEHIYVNSSGTSDQDVWDFGSETTKNGQWQRYETKIVTGSQGQRNGKILFRRNINGNYLVDSAFGSGRAIQSQAYNYPTSHRYGSVMWQNWWGNGYSNGDIALDDHYVQIGSFRCVELWNSPTPASATLREIQPPTAWSDTSVTVKLNKGGLPAGTYYLVVLDDTEADTVLASKEITVA